MPRTALISLVLSALIVAPIRPAHAEENAEFDILEARFDTAVADFMQEYTAADSEQAREEMMANPHIEPRARFTPEFHAAALAHEGELRAVPFLVWLVRHGSLSSPEVGEAAIRALFDRHLGDPGIEKLPGALYSLRNVRGFEATEASLNKALRTGESKSLRGVTLVYRGRLREKAGREEPARVDLEEALTLDLEDDLAGRAREALARLESPLVGSRAPNLVGSTLRDPTFDAEELEGKVVLVSFWGMWCGPCVAELPTLQEFADRFGGRGFRIIGVNSDEDVDRLREFLKQRNISWSQLLDGSTQGEIAREWRVSSWPMSYLLDREGIVRHRGSGVAELEIAIGRLLAGNSQIVQ